MESKPIKLSPAEQKIVSGPPPETMEEALQNAKDLIDERTGANLVPKIRTFDQDIRRFEYQAKTIKEMLQSKVEALPEFATVESLKEQLKQAREALKQATIRLPGYNDLCESLADEKDSLKSAKLNMQDFLLGYFAETRERQIELADKDQREVILKARLGKPKDYQLNLLTQGSEE